MKKMSDTLPPFPALEAETKSPTAFKNRTYQNKKVPLKQALENFKANVELTRRPPTQPEGRKVLCGRVERLVSPVEELNSGEDLCKAY